MVGGKRRRNIIRVVVIDIVIGMRKIDIVIAEMDIGRRKGRGIEMMRNINLRNDIPIETILKGDIEIETTIIDLKRDLETTTDIADETKTSNQATPTATTKTENETDPPTVPPPPVVPPPPSATDNTTAPPTVVIHPS